MYDQSDCEYRMRRILLGEAIFLQANMSACEVHDMCWHVLLDGARGLEWRLCSECGNAYERPDGEMRRGTSEGNGRRELARTESGMQISQTPQIVLPHAMCPRYPWSLSPDLEDISINDQAILILRQIITQSK
jgi:hypothetical protein